MPAALLPFSGEVRRIARAAPPGEAVLVAPPAGPVLRAALRAVAPAIRAGGRHATFLRALETGTDLTHTE